MSLKPQQDYETVKGFSEAVVKHMAGAIPQRFVARSGPRNRPGRIFIDYLRNGWVQSTAKAFSARARPVAVSMPITWEELDAIRSAAHWNIITAVERLAALARDPWAGYWKSKQSLGGAMEKLGYAA